MRRSDADRYVESILIDALTLHARYYAAMRHLDQSADDGYPSTLGLGSTVGGRFAGASIVEARVVDPHPDPAAIARAKIACDLVETASHLKVLTRHISAWWIPGSEAGRDADSAARASLDNLACPNHLVHGYYEMRAHHRRLCGWCYDTSIAKDEHGELLYGEPPDRILILERARLGRLTSRQYADFKRRLDARKGDAKKRRKGGPA